MRERERGEKEREERKTERDREERGGKCLKCLVEKVTQRERES